MDDTPAGRAGILAGDYITAIDGQSVVGLPLDQAVKQMRGPVGSPITLTVAREKVDPFSIKLVREVINVKSVTARTEGEFGYIRISGFDEKTGSETRAAIRDLKTKIPNMKGMVLDLRNNPGGLVDQAVEVSSVFLNGGEVVSQRGRDPRDIQRYNARAGGDMLNGLPVVVIVNNGSASASEIVAGALRDRKRAEVIGLTSFGKGSVQTVIPLRGGVDGALKLTTARYFTPSGQSIQKTGIQPDLEVASSKEEAERVADAALQFSEASFHNALDADVGKTRREAHTPTEIPPEGYDAKKDDFQLARALDVLRAGSVEAAVRTKPVQTYAMVAPYRVGAAASASPATTTNAGAVTDAKPVAPSTLAPAEKIAPPSQVPAPAR